MEEDSVSFVLSGFTEIMHINDIDYGLIGKKWLIPQFSANVIAEICQKARAAFAEQKTNLIIKGNVCIVGDIHGAFQDLVRILRHFGQDQIFLFLGDYVDRGPFSLECMILLLALKLKYPERFYLIRGNHECAEVASQYGFKDEILTMYREEIFNEFTETFNWLPLSAVVNDKLFCVHGGITPSLHNISQIDAIERPLIDIASNQMAKLMLWSDPSTAFQKFREGVRGTGIRYGPMAVDDFLDRNHLEWIVRGHECVSSGVQFKHGMKVVTVFSSSNYRPTEVNESGVLLALPDGSLEPIKFPEIKKMAREEASFFTMTKTTGTRRETHKLGSSYLRPEITQSGSFKLRSPMLRMNSIKKFDSAVANHRGSVPTLTKFLSVSHTFADTWLGDSTIEETGQG